MPDDHLPDDDAADDEPRTPRGGRNFLVGLALGALIGAGIALLLAPERGSHLRRRVGRGLRRMRSRADRTLDDLKDEFARRKRRIRARLG